METTKTCTKCHETKDVGEFYVWKKTGKPESRCKVCVAAYVAAHKEGDRVRHQCREYGVTVERAKQLLACTHCECCGVQFNTGKGTGGHTDHNHLTKIVRGRLCESCNRALGHVHDSPALADYLERSAPAPQLVKETA